MKLRLTQKHYEAYTGQMGVVFFENGLSTDDVSTLDATRMAAVLGCEWEDGKPANIGQIYLDNMNTAPPSAETVAAVPAKEKKAPEKTGTQYTEDQLAEIADAKGISGLREISDTLGVKGNSIRGLIDAILKSSGAPQESK